MRVQRGMHVLLPDNSEAVVIDVEPASYAGPRLTKRVRCHLIREGDWLQAFADQLRPVEVVTGDLLQLL